MARDANSILSHLGELESLAEEILTEKQQIVDLDRKRNQSREAVRALKNQSDTIEHSRSRKEIKTWVCFGNTFVKMPSKDVQVMLRGDQKKLDQEIDGLRNGLKPKVSKLREMEGMTDRKGFDLNPMSKDELKALNRSEVR